MKKIVFFVMAVVVFSFCSAVVPVAVMADQSVDKRSNIDKLTDPDPTVRRNAVIYLGAEKNKANIPTLIRMLDDSNIEVKRAAINSLVNMKSTRAETRFFAMLKTEKNVSVKVNLISALGDMQAKTAVQALEGLLSDPYPLYRSEALKALGKINDPQTYPGIVNMLKDEAEGVRIMAAQVSAMLKLSEAIPLIAKNTNDGVGAVRRISAQALGELGDISVMADLQKLLTDKDQSVVIAARNAIDHINSKSKPAEQQPSTTKTSQ